MRFRHGELCRFTVDQSDGERVFIMVSVEVKRVPRRYRRRLVTLNGKRSGWAAMHTETYELCYGVKPWHNNVRVQSRLKH